MRGVTVSPVVRLVAVAAVSVVLVGGAAATAASHAPAPPAPEAPRIHYASLAPHGAAGPMTFQQIADAAQTCATYAAAAGWANNGYYGGNLVTATAVCVAESGGNPVIYYCDGDGTVGTYPPVTCPGGSYDRGLWQVNSKAWPQVPDSCAFQPRCNANAAYAISVQGGSFSPWTVYNSTGYTRYLGAAQRAVDGLAGGALASAAFGVCATRANPAPGAPVVVGACGRSLAAQQWTISAGTLRAGTLCLAAGASGQPAVTTATCSGDDSQTWTADGLGGLKNAQTGQCLRDPDASHTAGTPLGLAPCSNTRGRTWWLP